MTKKNDPKLSRGDMLRIGQSLRAHFEASNDFETLTPELALLMVRLKDRLG